MAKREWIDGVILRHSPRGKRKMEASKARFVTTAGVWLAVHGEATSMREDGIPSVDSIPCGMLLFERGRR